MTAPALDDLLDIDQCAAWLAIDRRTLLEKAAGRDPEIPSFRFGSCKCIRFHPRTILARAAARSGVPVNVIAASFGISLQPEGVNTNTNCT